MRRVYAVLDESACGVGFPIDCGIVSLDPTAASALPADDYGLMPYRPPLQPALALSPLPPKPVARSVCQPLRAVCWD